MLLEWAGDVAWLSFATVRKGTPFGVLPGGAGDSLVALAGCGYSAPTDDFGGRAQPTDPHDASDVDRKDGIDASEGYRADGGECHCGEAAGQASGSAADCLAGCVWCGSFDNESLVACFMSACYKQHWDIDVATPPVKYNEDFGIWVSVVYLGDRVYQLRWAGCGNVNQAEVSPVLVRPQGTIRCLVVGIARDYVSVAEDFDSEWVAAQQHINAQHQAFASESGLDRPILQFENTNIVLTPEQLRGVDVESEAAFSEELVRLGYDPGGYDVSIVMDLDPHTQKGGVNAGKHNVIHWYLSPLAGVVDISSPVWKSFAQTAYHHEVGHAHGWEHDWGREPDSRFITYPEFYGWTDLDGDDMIEVWDPDPYASDSCDAQE